MTTTPQMRLSHRAASSFMKCPGRLCCISWATPAERRTMAALRVFPNASPRHEMLGWRSSLWHKRSAPENGFEKSRKYAHGVPFGRNVVSCPGATQPLGEHCDTGGTSVTRPSRIAHFIVSQPPPHPSTHTHTSRGGRVRLNLRSAALAPSNLRCCAPGVEFERIRNCASTHGH